ncbi:hypothetical protein [Paenibacillus turpanensis]|uniref:hypothetical protein n=1 Tax=Paenibacillus turpanensis TaxID=2689078 RepID=UPI00140E4DAF|nr:hypothetical protein [Paenibacillus turpanensis]
MAVLQNRRLLLLLSFVLAVLVCDLYVIRSSSLQNAPELLAIAVASDWLIAVPFALYFYSRRRVRSVAPVLITLLLGCWVTLLLVPSGETWTARIVYYLLIPLEIGFIVYELTKLTQFIRAYRKVRQTAVNALEAIRTAVQSSLGDGLLARLLMHDISLFYYAFFSWGKARQGQKREAGGDSLAFTYHQESNWLIMVMMISKIIIFEAFAMHLLVAQWSHIAAWVLTVGDVYVLLFLWADYRAMRLNPLKFEEGRLKVRYGLRMHADIDAAWIAKAETVPEYELTKEESKKSAYPVFETPNVLLQLTSPVEVILPFGVKRVTDRVYLKADKPHALVSSLQGCTEG